MSKSHAFRDVLCISNLDKKLPLTIVLEPWGDELEVPPMETYYVVVRSTNEGTIEVAHRPDAMTVWAWPGAVMDVFDRNGRTVQDLSIPVPDLPPGIGGLPAAVKACI
jgi:hypothetical protein